jgi:hypothetical protein
VQKATEEELAEEAEEPVEGAEVTDAADSVADTETEAPLVEFDDTEE